MLAVLDVQLQSVASAPGARFGAADVRGVRPALDAAMAQGKLRVDDIVAGGGA
jgi:hypothetical protein